MPRLRLQHLLGEFWMQWDECEERKPDKRRTTRRRRGRQTVDSTTTGYGEWMKRTEEQEPAQTMAGHPAL